MGKHFNVEFTSSGVKTFMYVTKECDYYYYIGDIREYIEAKNRII